ncbi:MAG: iron-sulfur cluster-binding domain-containing protein [Pseudonocardia sp.]|nr:MAG: iron-sulfur cluster-binding domain-containing protein [Pseudonocardia sp.]
MLIGGGIGITPLLAMAEHLHESGIPFELLYRARTRSRAGFLDRIGDSAWRAKATVVLSDEPEYSTFCLDDYVARSPTGAHLYTCGPDGFVSAVERAATLAQFPPATVHKELFTNSSLQDPTEDREFKVTLAQSGGTYTIPCGKSVAEVLEAEGISVLVSCEQGVCGSCVVPVIDGIPDHRDVFLTDEEHEANDEFTPCCSRAVTDHMVIDL